MTEKKQSKVAMLGTGGEPHPNMTRSKASFILDEMGGEARTTVLMCPHNPLRIGGGPHPNASKVEGLVHFRRDGGRGPDNGPYVPPQSVRNRRRISS